MDYFTSCYLCGSSNLKPLSKYQRAFLSKCSDCGFVFATKKPTLAELEEHYKGYTRRDYISPITIKRYNELLDEMEAYRKTNKIIDVGCGVGFFLEQAKKRGWEVYGTEFTDEAVEICTKKGININKGVLDYKNYDPEMFDVITSFEVIEHINNPNSELENFNKILRKGGLVYVTTPNFNSFSRYYIGPEYNIICYPEHLSYYSAQTLKKVFNKAQFKKLKIETTGISVTRIKTSKGKSDQAFISASSDDEIIRGKIESKWYLAMAKKMVNSFLTFTNKGDSLKGWFIKK